MLPTEAGVQPRQRFFFLLLHDVSGPPEGTGTHGLRGDMALNVTFGNRSNPRAYPNLTGVLPRRRFVLCPYTPGRFGRMHGFWGDLAFNVTHGRCAYPRAYPTFQGFSCVSFLSDASRPLECWGTHGLRGNFDLNVTHGNRAYPRAYPNLTQWSGCVGVFLMRLDSWKFGVLMGLRKASAGI